MKMGNYNSCYWCYLARRVNSPSFTTTVFCSMGVDKADQVAYLDAEISRTEDDIVSLVRQRAMLKRRRNAFSPAVNLPPEILSLIFEFACLPVAGGNIDLSTGGAKFGAANLGLGVGMGAVTPLFIGTVCSAWRKIAQSSSQLWNTVVVYLDNGHSDAQASLLKLWLQNSAQRPLSIKLIEDEHTDNEDEWCIDVTSTAVIDVLAAHSSQWHTIDFFLPSTWKSALSRVRHNLSLLTNATFRVAEGSPTILGLDAFAFAPQLREVSVIGFSIDDMALPWTQLERISGEYFSVGECLDAIRLCPGLRSAIFEQVCAGQIPFSSRPIHHENLEVLELTLPDTTWQPPSVIGAMTLPSLKELVLSLPDDEPLLRTISPLVRRSGCQLRHLHFVGITPPEHELIECLKEVSTLEVLLLLNPLMDKGGVLTQQFLEHLNPRSGKEGGGEGGVSSGCLLPRLKKFVYQGSISFSTHSLIQCLASRWRSGGSQKLDENSSTVSKDNLTAYSGDAVSQLRSVEFTTAKKIKFDGADSKTLQELLKEGMKLLFLADPNADGPGW